MSQSDYPLLLDSGNLYDPTPVLKYIFSFLDDEPQQIIDQFTPQSTRNTPSSGRNRAIQRMSFDIKDGIKCNPKSTIVNSQQPNMAACEKSCIDNNGCVMWSYNEPANLCQQFDSRLARFQCTHAIPKDDYHTGYIYETVPSVSYFGIPGMNYPGNTYRTMKHALGKDCVWECATDPECVGFSQDSTGTCYLKNKISNPVRDINYQSSIDKKYPNAQKLAGPTAYSYVPNYYYPD